MPPARPSAGPGELTALLAGARAVHERGDRSHFMGIAASTKWALQAGRQRAGSYAGRQVEGGHNAMNVGRRLAGGLVGAALAATLIVSTAAPSSATIHPIIQSVNCASATAWANAHDFGDPGGQTPAGLTAEIMSFEGSLLIISFPEPLTFTQSDFRALQATGFIDEVRRSADGRVTALVVDLTSIPNAANGQGGAHCGNAP